MRDNLPLLNKRKKIAHCFSIITVRQQGGNNEGDDGGERIEVGVVNNTR